MAETDWHYNGDVNLREGGLFWQDTSSEDTVSFVKVIAYKDAGGPDNLFRLTTGHIDLDRDAEQVASALSAWGTTVSEASREVLVLALEGYGGASNEDEEVVVRVGTPDATWSGRGEFPEPDHVLRSNQSLRKWVEREYLHAPDAAPAPGM